MRHGFLWIHPPNGQFAKLTHRLPCNINIRRSHDRIIFMMEIPYPEIRSFKRGPLPDGYVEYLRKV